MALEVLLLEAGETTPLLLAEADMLTLRRFALLSLIEVEGEGEGEDGCASSNESALLAVQEAMRRRELGQFLLPGGNNVLTRLLAERGLIGAALLAACQQHSSSSSSSSDAVAVLARLVSLEERSKAGMRFVRWPGVLAVLLASCQGQREHEAWLVQAWLPFALLEEEDSSVAGALVAALHCLGVRRLTSSRSVLFQCCRLRRGSLSAVQRAVITQFDWTPEELAEAKRVCGGEDDALPVVVAAVAAPRVVQQQYKDIADYARRNDYCAISALQQQHMGDLQPVRDAVLVGAQHGAYEAVSRLFTMLPVDEHAAMAKQALLHLAAASSSEVVVISSRLVSELVKLVTTGVWEACSLAHAGGADRLLDALLQAADAMTRSRWTVEHPPAVTSPLSPRERRTEQEQQGVVLRFIDLHDDALERIFSFLPLDALAKTGRTCRALSGTTRPRAREQLVCCLVQDFDAAHREQPPPASLHSHQTRLVQVYSATHALELWCKERALSEVLRRATSSGDAVWTEDEVRRTTSLLGLAACADGGAVPSLLDQLLLLQTSSSQFALDPQAVRAMLAGALTNEQLPCALGCILKHPSARWGGSRPLVDLVRQQAALGHAPATSLLVATMSRLAVESRAKRDALVLKRRQDWEARGGVWGPQQEEQFRVGATEQEQDFDLAVQGAMRRAGSEGHSIILTSLLKMLKARNRLGDFAAEFERVLECAARGEHVAVLRELLHYYRPVKDHPVLHDTLMTAARNGHHAVARLLVWELQLVSESVVKHKFIEGARKGHFEAVRTLMATGAIGAGTCMDAIDEATRRGFVDDLVPFLQDALGRLQKFEEEEEEEE